MLINNKHIAVLSLVLGLGLATVGAQAAGKGIQGQKFGHWGGNCETLKDKTQVCYLEQVLSEQGKKEPLMMTVIGYGQKQQFPTVIFELSQGVDVKSGAQLRIDKYPPVGLKGFCEKGRCRFGLTLDNPRTQQIRKGKELRLAFKANAKAKEPTVLPVSLKGMSAGLNALAKTR